MENLEITERQPGDIWFKIHMPLFPFLLGGKWNLWKKVRTTYLVNTDRQDCPIRVELEEKVKK